MGLEGIMGWACLGPVHLATGNTKEGRLHWASLSMDQNRATGSGELTLEASICSRLA
jgi:hypothetical protein